MRRHRKWTACALIVALLLPLLAPSLTLLPQKTGAEELNFGNPHITPYQNKEASGNVEGPPTWRYAVGFMSYDIWRNSSGVWSPKKPGDAVTGSDNLKWTYTFSFTDRIVRNVDAYIFNPANSEHIEFFEMSRGTSFKPYEDYVSPVSDITKSNEIGKGTSSITFDIALSGSLSGVSQPIPCDSCNEGVQGLRYYFPIVFKFELDGLKTTRFFSTTGEKLRDEEKTNMEKGRTISTTPPAISGYRYVGYKKSTDGNSPAGEIIPGPPPSFTYDGSFDHYIIQLYYEPDTAPDKPDLVAEDIVANGPIEVGKPISFTAIFRNTGADVEGKNFNVKIMEGATNVKIETFISIKSGEQLTIVFTYTFTSTAQKTFLLVVDSANAIAESDESNNQVSRSFTPGSGSSQPEPEEPPLVCTAPPVARITAPSEKMAGDLVEISGAESQATAPATIAAYQWQLEGTGSTLSGPGGVAIYPTPGSFTIALRVTDSNGCTGEATHRITITVPTPTAFPDYAGAPKENRKVTLDGTKSFSPPGYPITRYEWTIEPVSGGSASAIKYDGTLTGSRKDLLIKQAGTYVVTLTVTNSYGISATASRQIVIAPDEPPVASFTVVKEVLRDPARGMMAPLKARDASYSPDGDMIAQRIWSYRYDSDNDGDFDEETPVIIDTGNKTEIEHLVPDVGRYQIYLEVVESFGQPTIQQFVTAGDYRRGYSWK